MVRYTVVDEADELLTSDWEEDFKKLMSGGGKETNFQIACTQLRHTD